MNEETRVFEERPFTTAIFTTVVMLVIWVLMALLVYFMGPPRAHSKFARMGITSSGEAAVFLFLSFTLVVGVVWLICSFLKQLTIVCDSSGFTVYSKSFWDPAETMRVFKWAEAAGVYIRTGAKNSRVLTVILPGEEMHLMSRTIFNAKEFRELEAIFERRIAAAHPKLNSI